MKSFSVASSIFNASDIKFDRFVLNSDDEEDWSVEYSSLFMSKKFDFPTASHNSESELNILFFIPEM